MFRPFCSGLFVCATLSLQAASPVPSLSQAKTALAGLPLRFEANQGQWKPDVRFAARSGSLFVAMTGHGPSLSFGGSRRVDIRLNGSNAAPRMEPLDRLAAQTDYYLGSRQNWHTGVTNYSRVSYREVYPGVDVVYYGNRNQLEYDFVMQPGADPRAIRLQFRGARRTVITAEGDLMVEAAGGSILQRKPVVRQDGREIAGNYTLLGRNQVGFKLGSYDRSRPLVIDPVLLYSTYLGGSASDQVNAVRVDAKGRLYVTGPTDTSGIPYVDGAWSNSNHGSTNIFLCIFDTSAAGNYQLVYSSYLGGSSIDIPLGMAIDTQGNIYLTGITSSANFPVAGNSLQTAQPSSSYSCAFILQLNPSVYGGDSLLYSTYVGGTDGNTWGNGIDVDASGNIYVIGTTRATDYPLTTSGYAQVIFGPQDAFVIELNPNSSSAIYSSYLGGELDDDGRAIAVGPDGLVYVAISTNSLGCPLEGYSYQDHLTGNQGSNVDPNLDVYIGVMNMNLFGEPSLLYSTYIGGTSNDEVRGIAFDRNGNVVLTGYTLSADFPVTADAAQKTYGGNGDAFVLVANWKKPGFLVYSTFLGGSDGEVGYGVATDSDGYIYTTGYTLSADFPTKNAMQSTWGQGVDVYITKLKPGVAGYSGLQYSTYLGDATVNAGYSLAVGADGRLYVGGVTGGLWPTTEGSIEGFSGGRKDGFVIVLSK